MEITSEISEVGAIVGPSLLPSLKNLFRSPPLSLEAGASKMREDRRSSDFRTPSIGLRVQLRSMKNRDERILNSDAPDVT